MTHAGKKLTVSAAVVDVTQVTEEKVKVYEAITINCAMVLSTAESMEILGRHGVRVNAANVMQVPSGCKLYMINGPKTLSAADMAQEPAVMIINGNVTVCPDGAACIRSYENIMINGRLLYPESAKSIVGALQVNGASCSYPDGAVVLSGTASVDPFFILRAGRDAFYFAADKLLIEEPGLDMAALLEKNVRFKALDAVVRGDYMAQAALLLTEDTPVRLIPEGYAYVTDTKTGLKSLIARFGKKLFIDGNLLVGNEDREALASLEGLQVRGEAAVAPDLESLFYEKCPKADSVKIIAPQQGRLIADVAEVLVTRQMLEENEDGLRFLDVVQLKLDDDIPASLLRERIRSVSDTARILCTDEQKAVLLPLCHDVGMIQTGGEPAAEDDSGNETYINCAHYVF